MKKCRYYGISKWWCLYLYLKASRLAVFTITHFIVIWAGVSWYLPQDHRPHGNPGLTLTSSDRDSGLSGRDVCCKNEMETQVSQLSHQRTPILSVHNSGLLAIDPEPAHVQSRHASFQRYQRLSALGSVIVQIECKSNDSSATIPSHNRVNQYSPTTIYHCMLSKKIHLQIITLKCRLMRTQQFLVGWYIIPNE